MKKEIKKGAKEFCKMFAIYIDKLMNGRISNYEERWEGGIRQVFHEGINQLFTLYINDEVKKILLFSNLENEYPVLYSDLLNLFSFLGFVIEDKSK